MSLGTRCAACGTVFRVVQDQLRVSEGWVRCGRCDEVFNAMDNLFDLDASKGEPAPAAPAVATASLLQRPSLPPEDDGDIVQLNDDDRIHSRFFAPEAEPAQKRMADSVDERDRLDFADARFNESFANDGSAISSLPPVDSLPSPSFTRSRPRPRASAWLQELPQRLQALRRPPGAAAWAGAALLAFALLAQILGHFRDTLAETSPALRSVLAPACALFGCSIDAPRRIDDLSVESSALSPANGGSAYKLAIVLRNRHPRMKLKLPSIDLTLTDSEGELVARRMFSPEEFRPAIAALAPHSEVPLQLLMSVEGRRVSGYTVEIFYP